MKSKILIYFFLISLLFGNMFFTTSCSSFESKNRETDKPGENVEEAKQDTTEAKNNYISMQEAVELVLAEAKKWNTDAEITEIENLYSINQEGLGTKWLITVVSRSTPPFQEGFGEEFFTGRRYIIEEGRISLDSDDSIIETFGLLDVKNVMDSPEAVKIAIENGSPEKWGAFSLFLGNEKDFEEYGKIVLNVFTVLMDEGAVTVKSTIIDPVSGQIIKVY